MGRLWAMSSPGVMFAPVHPRCAETMFNFKRKPSPRDRINRWQGYAIVYQTIYPDRPGRVRFNAISWGAQSKTGELIPIDARVEVLGHEGIDLVVRRC